MQLLTCDGKDLPDSMQPSPQVQHMKGSRQCALALEMPQIG